MNYYNPYLYNFPMGMQATNTGLISRLLGGRTISFSNILNGTQRVLNIANQTIPLVKQAKPMFSNMKTMFRVMNEFKRNDKLNNDFNNNDSIIKNTSMENNEIQNSVGPTFFE